MMDMAEKLPVRRESDGYLDEKASVKSELPAIVNEVGDVFEDVRAIDLGEDGKERPIGAYCFRGVEIIYVLI